MRRVFGIETEYGVTCASTVGEISPLPAEAAARELFSPILARYRTTNLFLPNGGRLYLDVGSHPEYATAECDHLSDLLAQEAAGDRILSELAQQLNNRWLEEGFSGRIHLFKNNLDSAGNSFGCHENYLVNRAIDFKAITDGLVTFFVIRQMLLGSGYLAKNGEFGFSQRSETMDEVVSAATTRAHPIINTRDEPLADSTHFRRLHVVSGDSNCCSATTWLKIGMTQALLDAIDAGLDLSDLVLANPIQAIKEINRDLTGQTIIELANGKKIRAIELLRLLYCRVIRTLVRACPVDDCPLPGIRPPHYCPPQTCGEGLLCLGEKGYYSRRPEPKTVLGCVKSGIDAKTAHTVMEMWNRAITALETENWDLVATELDWVIKYRLFDRISKAKQLSWSSPELARLDLAYHDITDAGLRQQLMAAGLMKQLIDQEDIRVAQTKPPQTTRAALRGKTIAAAWQHRRDLTADWIHLRLDESRLPTITLNDPLETSNQKVDELLAEMGRK